MPTDFPLQVASKWHCMRLLQAAGVLCAIIAPAVWWLLVLPRIDVGLLDGSKLGTTVLVNCLLDLDKNLLPLSAQY
jgi:hypothetical protein